MEDGGERSGHLVHLSKSIVIVTLLCLGLVACSSGRSFERETGGKTVYFDQLSPTAKTEARQQIAEHLTREIPVYKIAVGDELNAFFDIDAKPTSKEYLIEVTDQLRIEFLDDRENNQTVTVRPDGFVSLLGVGTIRAAGLSSEALARQIEVRYQRMLGTPQVTVDVLRSHSPLDRFIAMLGSTNSSMSLTTKVLPDGTISLPQLAPVRAQGRTLEELKLDIDRGYSKQSLSVSVSLIPHVLRSGSTMVIGEVPKPGRISLARPHTVLTAVAQAGGVLPTGSMKSVRMIYIGGDGQPRARVVNLKSEMDDLSLESDMIVPDNSVIYVPPTDLAKAGRIAKAIAEVLQFQGVSAAYIIDQPNSSTSIVP